MRAYAIGHLHIHDPSWVEEYVSKLPALLEKHGGRRLAAGGAIETLEGESALPEVVVVLEFPSMEKARAWHNDPDYRPLIKLRQTGSKLDLLLVEGVPAE